MENKETYNCSEVANVVITLYNRLLKRYEIAANRQTNGIRPSGTMRGLEIAIEEVYATLETIAPGKLISPGNPIVNALRKNFPNGCKIVLDEMDDSQSPPVGTTGTVCGVDDAGSILSKWDVGGSLSVVYGKDRCHRLYTVKRCDKKAIPIEKRYPSGSRVMLDRDEGNTFPPGITGTVGTIDGCGCIRVHWDGYPYAGLTPGKDSFHRIWDTTTDPMELARMLHAFCEETHYRQSPTIIGFWQPDASASLTKDRLMTPAGVRCIIKGIYQFRKSTNLPWTQQTKADKLLHDLNAQYDRVYPMLGRAKDAINRFMLREYKNKYGADFSDLSVIHVANTNTEDGREVQVDIDLINYAIRTYVDGKLVNVLQHESLEDIFTYDLLFLDFDVLVEIPDQDVVPGGTEVAK